MNHITHHLIQLSVTGLESYQTTHAVQNVDLAPLKSSEMLALYKIVFIIIKENPAWKKSATTIPEENPMDLATLEK